jgi:hypothetical protein
MIHELFQQAMQQSAQAPAEPTQYAPLARGFYALVIERAEFKPNSKNTGYLVNVGFSTPTNRWLWKSFNVLHSNPKAQEIGQQQWANLLAAIGMSPSDFTDPSQVSTLLPGLECEAFVIVDKMNENQISYCLPSGTKLSAPQPAATGMDYDEKKEGNFDDFTDDIPF